MSFHHWAALFSTWVCGIWFDDLLTVGHDHALAMVILLGVAAAANIMICIAKYGYLGGWVRK